MSRIAFAGLGAMSYGMATHLLRPGFPVNGYDVYQPSIDRLASDGARSANTIREAVKDADFLICMVANSIQATQLLFDPKTGAIAAMSENATILMCSTVAPAFIDEIRRRLVENARPDIRLIDSPVSGGAGRAANGTLSIFSSGDDVHLAHVQPILECLSAKLYKIPGGLGGGSKAKLIHQILAGVNIAMASEAMGLAAKAGLNTKEAFEELRNGEGSSWMFENRVPHMLDPNLPPYSAITIIAKDVGIITSTSRAFKFPLPMLSTSEQLYSTAIPSGLGKEDDCVLVRLYLPGQPDLVAQQTKAENGAKPSMISVNDIMSMMTAVLLAAMVEAMCFCERLGIDTVLMYDIVANAAGASAIFVKVFNHMQKGKWSLKAVLGIEKIRDCLVGTALFSDVP